MTCFVRTCVVAILWVALFVLLLSSLSHAEAHGLKSPRKAEHGLGHHGHQSSRHAHERRHAPPLASSGLASWYGPQHHGRRTASGERFDMNAMTAAHRTLPFGTRVKVCRTTRCVVVRVTDRGPARWTGRIIDLSRAAAQALGMLGAGVAMVTVERR